MLRLVLQQVVQHPVRRDVVLVERADAVEVLIGHRFEAVEGERPHGGEPPDMFIERLRRTEGE